MTLSYDVFHSVHRTYPHLSPLLIWQMISVYGNDENVLEEKLAESSLNTSDHSISKLNEILLMRNTGMPSEKGLEKFDTKEKGQNKKDDKNEKGKKPKKDKKKDEKDEDKMKDEKDKKAKKEKKQDETDEDETKDKKKEKKDKTKDDKEKKEKKDKKNEETDEDETKDKKKEKKDEKKDKKKNEKDKKAMKDKKKVENDENEPQNKKKDETDENEPQNKKKHKSDDESKDKKKKSKNEFHSLAFDGYECADEVDTDFDRVIPCKGKRKALLIGINYDAAKSKYNKLDGCINDVKMMGSLIKKFGFGDPENTMVLTDEIDCTDPKKLPSKFNILNAICWLVIDAKPGDVLFFHFSGHGSQAKDSSGDETDGYDETILPSDHETSGPIIDDELHDMLVASLPYGCRLIAVMDCCHSGTGLDLPYNWNTEKQDWSKSSPNGYFPKADVQLFSGCLDHETSMDISTLSGGGGAMTIALNECLNQDRNWTYVDLIQAINKNLQKRFKRVPQRPSLSSSQTFTCKRTFNMTDIVPNHNSHIGRKKT